MSNSVVVVVCRNIALVALCIANMTSECNGCVQFWSGLCPGSDDCQCTTGAACINGKANASLTRPVTKDGGCAGSCRKVIRNQCPHGSECMVDAGACGSPPSPPPPPSPHPSPPPPGGRPQGPDVSSYQGRVDWNAVKSQGAGFGIAKATEGLSVTDSEFANNWANMKTAGIKVRGAYHFGHPSESATDQASHFTRTVGSVGYGEFLVLDIESATTEMRQSGNWSKHSQNSVATWCQEFVNSVMSQANIGKNKMWIYTGAWFWDPQTGGSSILSSHPLWVSGYSEAPPVPKGWGDWTMWQFTDKGSWRGISGGCDSSSYHGSQAGLEFLVR